MIPHHHLKLNPKEDYEIRYLKRDLLLIDKRAFNYVWNIINKEDNLKRKKKLTTQWPILLWLNKKASI